MYSKLLGLLRRIKAVFVKPKPTAEEFIRELLKHAHAVQVCDGCMQLAQQLLAEWAHRNNADEVYDIGAALQLQDYLHNKNYIDLVNKYGKDFAIFLRETYADIELYEECAMLTKAIN